jgi:hypothetical protein
VVYAELAPQLQLCKVWHMTLEATFYERRQDMAATSLFTCTCGIQKKTTNHWVLAKVTPGGITFMPWDINLAFDDEIIVLCGERCASALLSRYMGDWKRPSVNVTVNEPELAVA